MDPRHHAVTVIPSAIRGLCHCCPMRHAVLGMRPQAERLLLLSDMYHIMGSEILTLTYRRSLLCWVPALKPTHMATSNPASRSRSSPGTVGTGSMQNMLPNVQYSA